MLGLAGLALFLGNDTRNAYLFLISGIFGWAVVAAGHQDVRPSAVIRQVGTEIAASARGVSKRLTDPKSLRVAFAHANERLALTTPLPVYPGPSDLYSSNIADLIANGAQWDPRPIVQSTSAYTPTLLALNLSHLQNDAPAHVYFRPSPEDDRYPAFEDAASWPQLFSAFEAVSMAGDYAVLSRRVAPVDVAVSKPMLSTTMVLGARMPLAAATEPLWATIKVEPTLLGRFVSLIYRLPPLRMKLTYSDQSTNTYRFIPGIAQAGFLLSPTVVYAEDFVALGSPQRERFLAGRRPVFLAIDAPGHGSGLWQQTYRVTLSPLSIPADPRVDALLMSRRVARPGSAARVLGGDCSFSAVDDKPLDDARQEVALAPGIVHIRGWAMLLAKRGTENKGVVLELEDATTGTQWFEATRYPRVDVTIYFGLPFVSRSGYEVVFDTRGLQGSYTLRVLQSDGSKNLTCANELHFKVQNPAADSVQSD
jgi:hypothetical protein